MSTDRTVLIDERSDPDLRAVIGGLLTSSESADFAVTRIRLAAMDLTDEEVAIPRCRLLLGALDASMLDDASYVPTAARADVGRLLGWVRSGRLEIRSAGIGGWIPDFSIYRAGNASTCLLGAHYFGNPQLSVGPSFTCLVRDAASARIVADRFDALWDRSHDVLPAIRDVLELSR